MERKQFKSDKTTDLREKAEYILRHKGAALNKIKIEDTRDLIHELQVHQFELEMQNDELLKTQGELERSRIKYYELFDFAPIGYFILDQKGIILEANLTGIKMLGLGKKILKNLPFIVYVASEYRRSFYGYLSSIFSDRTKHSLELKIEKRNGSGFYAAMESIAASNPDDGSYQCLVALVDINYKKIAENAIRQSAEDYRNLADSITDIFFAVDNDLRITFFNKASKGLANISEEKALGRKYKDAFTVLNNFDIDALLQKALASKISQNDITECKVKNIQLTYEVSVYPYSSGLSIFLKDITERRLAEKEIVRSREQFHSLAQHLLRIREEERAHLAREIHDELGQMLTSFKINLGWMRNKLEMDNLQMDQNKLRQELNQMYLQAGETINLVRKFVKDLKPTLLESLGLIDSIKWYLHDFEERFRIKYHLFTNLEDVQLSQDLITTLFRILQESLTNIVRHSKATRVEITIEMDKSDTIIMKVQDNGVGIDDDIIYQNRGFGLIGMRERANLQMGEFHIYGKPGTGTTVEVKIPFQSKADNS